MVATIKTIQGGAGSVSKYFGLMGGVSEYYDTDEMSEWQGRAAELLGLNGSVQRSEFENLLAGRGPDGHPLGRIRVDSPNSKTRRVPGYDMTLSVPKSVSVLWAIGDEHVRKEVQDAVLTSARRTMRELETNLPLARRGRGGKTQIHADLAVGMFFHKLSRANEPNLHVHCIVANACRGADGQWSSVNSRKLHEYTMTLGSVFRSHVFDQLKSRLDISVRPGQRRDGSQADWMEVKEIPHALVDRFSTRRKQIERRVGEKNLGNATARQQANFKTRAAKSEPLDFSFLHGIWRTEARVHGVDVDSLSQTILPPQPANVIAPTPETTQSVPDKDQSTPRVSQAEPKSRIEPENLAIEESLLPKPEKSVAVQSPKLEPQPANNSHKPAVSVPPPAEKTEDRHMAPSPLPVKRSQHPRKESQQPTVDQKKYQECFSETARELAEKKAYYSASEFMAALGSKLQKHNIHIPNLIDTVKRDLHTHKDIVVLPNTRRPLYSSRSYFEKEQTLVADARALTNRRGARVDLTAAEKLTRVGKDLNEEQARAAFHLLTQTSGLKILNAAAGSGHEKTLLAVCRGFRKSGHDVVGAALSGKASSELEKKTTADTRTVASWLYHLDRSELAKAGDALRHEAKMVGRAAVGKRRWERKKIQLPKNGVLVIDQANMLDTHAMSRLIHHANKAKCTVILTGDVGQLQPIGVGGPFDYLRKTAGYAELSEHQRQQSPADRVAVDALRDGRTGEALSSFHERGRLQVSELPVTELVNRWADSDAIRKPHKHIILAPTRSLQAEFNERCQQERLDHGRISGRGIRHGQTRYYVGDRVRFGRSQHRQGIETGSFGTVVGINPLTRRITVRLDDPPSEKSQKRFGATQTTTVSLLDLPDESLSLGYASTIHSAHGSECDHVWAIVDGGHKSQELAYSQISHGRESTRLFAVDVSEGSEIPRLEDEWLHSDRKNLAHDMMSRPDLNIEH